jgi:anti-sigma factor ChrR (cupin superfamily)
MIAEHQQEQASLYALGAMDEAGQRAFEAELRVSEELLRLVRDLQRTALLLAASSPAAPLPPQLRDQVQARIESLEAARKIPARPRPPLLPGLSFLAAADAPGWKQLPVPGAFIKLLSLEKERGYAVLLGKLERGARYPAHVNAGPEDIYILTGDLVVGDRKLGAGDFHHADKGSQHPENYSVEGCTLLAVLTTDDPLVAFAMA